ncbi:MAG: hypothetical protein RIS90_730, partial [Pseudomonadota bacterium]
STVSLFDARPFFEKALAQGVQRAGRWRGRCLGGSDG